jgi:hypothetical protein
MSQDSSLSWDRIRHPVLISPCTDVIEEGARPFGCSIPGQVIGSSWHINDAAGTRPDLHLGSPRCEKGRVVIPNLNASPQPRVLNVLVPHPGPDGQRVMTGVGLGVAAGAAWRRLTGPR